MTQAATEDKVDILVQLQQQLSDGNSLSEEIRNLLNAAVNEITTVRAEKKSPTAAEIAIAERARHEELMKTNTDYAERFRNISITKGKKFSVSLECVDSFGTKDLFSSLFAAEHPLVAGCLVTRISFQDDNERYDQLLKDIRAVADGRLTLDNKIT